MKATIAMQKKIIEMLAMKEIITYPKEGIINMVNKEIPISKTLTKIIITKGKIVSRETIKRMK